MSDAMNAGTMMIRESAKLPALLDIQSVAYCDDWRSLPDVDCYALDFKVRTRGWSMFFLGGELRTFVLGKGAGAVERAILRLTRRVSASRFNCMQVDGVRSKHRFGVPYVAVESHAFHIQIGSTLDVAAPKLQSRLSRFIQVVW